MASGDEITVHVRLLNEGTLVFRPTRAQIIDGDVVRLLPCEASNGEVWEFAPGSVVQLERREKVRFEHEVTDSRR